MMYILILVCNFAISVVSRFDCHDRSLVLLVQVPGHCFPFLLLFCNVDHNEQ